MNSKVFLKVSGFKPSIDGGGGHSSANWATAMWHSKVKYLVYYGTFKFWPNGKWKRETLIDKSLPHKSPLLGRVPLNLTPPIACVWMQIAIWQKTIPSLSERIVLACFERFKPREQHGTMVSIFAYRPSCLGLIHSICKIWSEKVLMILSFINRAAG